MLIHGRDSAQIFRDLHDDEGHDVDCSISIKHQALNFFLKSECTDEMARKLDR